MSERVTSGKTPALRTKASEVRVKDQAMVALLEGPRGFALCEPLPNPLAQGDRYLTMYRQRPEGWIWLGSLIASAEDAADLLAMWEGAGGRVVSPEELDGPKSVREAEGPTLT